MKRFRLFLIGLFAALLPALMAPSGGFPYLPTFGAITLAPSVSGGKFGINLNSTTAVGYNAVRFQTSGTATSYLGTEASAGQLCNGSAVGDYCTRIVSGKFRVSTDNGLTSADISPADSGTLIWSFQIANTNCSVNGVDASFALHKIGKVVVAKFMASGNCTTASVTNFFSSNTPVPAAFRPAAAAPACSPFQTSLGGVQQIAVVCISSAGNVQILPGAGGSFTTWTIVAGDGFSYTLD